MNTKNNYKTNIMNNSSNTNYIFKRRTYATPAVHTCSQIAGSAGGLYFFSVKSNNDTKITNV